MTSLFARTVRPLLIAAAVAIPASALAQQVELIYQDPVSETEPRSEILRQSFGACLGDEFNFKMYHLGSLFKQGTEVAAIQRGNLDMATVAIYDFYNQVPATTILGTAYMFRDYDHMRKVFNSDLLDGIWSEVREKMGVRVLSNPYTGQRHVNIRGNKKIMVPEDLAGIKLRMPPGEGWQFVGTALGANPTSLPFGEVYTSLQTGAIDGQDNPLPASKAMKFHEVTNQIVLTGHIVAHNQFIISEKKWQSLTDAQRETMQNCATKFEADMDQHALKAEQELIQFFKDEGLEVYTPDNAAFQKHVLEAYKNSRHSEAWPEGLQEEIFSF